VCSSDLLTSLTESRPPPLSYHWSSCWTTCLCFRLTFVNVTSQDHLKRIIFSGLLCRNDINTGRCDGFRVECVCYHKLLSFLWTATASLLAQYLQHCFVVYLNRWYAQTVFSLTETTVDERRIFLLLLMTQCYFSMWKFCRPLRSIHNVSSFPAFDLCENV
jgi:hypothetical protein